MSEAEQPELARLTVELLSAYVANNTVPKEELAGLIESTRAALSGVSSDLRIAKDHTPAVSIQDSLASPEHIVSLIDGKPYKTLKRHLGNNGLTADEYKARYNLPADYPLVAPSYSEHRRRVAKDMGLGGRPASAAPAPEIEVAAASPAAAAIAPKTAVPKSTSKGSPKRDVAAVAKPAQLASAKARKPRPVTTPAKQAEADGPSATLTAPPADVPATSNTQSIAPSSSQKASKPTRRMARAKNEASVEPQGEAGSAFAAAPASVKPRKKLGISTATKISKGSAPKQPDPVGKVKAAKKSRPAASKSGAQSAKASTASPDRPAVKRSEAKKDNK